MRVCRLKRRSHALEVPVGHHIVNGRILKSRLPDSEVPVYLIEQDAYFDRPGLYGDGKEDYRDNCERFVFFCRGVMEAIRELQLDVDIIHCHDWQTALMPAYLSHGIRHRPRLRAHSLRTHDSQPGLSRSFLALGHGPDRVGLEVLQLEAIGVFR